MHKSLIDLNANSNEEDSERLLQCLIKHLIDLATLLCCERYIDGEIRCDIRVGFHEELFQDDSARSIIR